MQTKTQTFNNICKNIKSLKIRGARDVAKSALRAYHLIPTNQSKKKLLSLRPTEPLLQNILKQSNPPPLKQLSEKLKQNQTIINNQTSKLIKPLNVIFTHCHSSTVIRALIHAKNKKKKFQVYHTETRPLFQGRRTARELKKAGIKATMFPDSAAQIALTKKQKTKKANLVLLGADAITKQGVVNKIGSNMFAQIAKQNKIPVYILTDSLKYTNNKIKIEQRSPEEVWKQAPEIQIKNPAFDLIEKKYITGIISEFGILSFDKFLNKVRKF